MKKTLFLGSFLLLLSCSNAIVEPGAGSKTYDFSSVDQFIEQNDSVYKNEVVVLVSQNGQLIYQNEHNLTATTNRVIASASKWLSGAVMMSLVDDRKLTLDDTVGKFLPIFSQHGKGNITIRQLFSHTSGFPGDSPQGYEYSKTMTFAEAVDSMAVYTNLIHAPGTTFNYGGVSMHIAGRIAEVVSGKSWQTLFNEKIALPCGMRATYILVNTQNPLIAGGARTTARDYLNFLEMIVNKGMYKNRRVLSAGAVSEMLKDQTNGATIENTPYPANPYSDYQNTGIRYGIGNWRDVVDQAGNAAETSSPGAFGAHPWQDSKNNVAGIIFTRTTPRLSNVTSLQIRQKIRDIIAQK